VMPEKCLDAGGIKLEQVFHALFRHLAAHGDSAQAFVGIEVGQLGGLLIGQLTRRLA